MSLLNTNDLHRIFDKLDQNGDGFVSLDELKWLLDKIGIQTSPEELESLAGKTNLDILDFLFFYDTVIKPNFGDQSEEGENLESDLAKAFRVYDVNGDGVISCEELQNVLSRLGLWNEQYGRDCKSMIDEYDMNSDGVLDFEEFKNMMLLRKS
ncbi:probable calcium-binding protein CML44 [Actinidia eriantha]|uniref:probable calcium-binding protein CML44 n=1 Tax=Actinidia eriantha TaxID=165200 RepID=UPI002585C8BE|nr:probable calcium-binding protein CML44 [Actinidia eriantha]